MTAVLAKMLATMLDPLLFGGTLIVWFACKRFGFLAAWWASMAYAGVLYVVAGNPAAVFRGVVAATVLTAAFWGLSRMLRRFSSSPSGQAPQGSAGSSGASRA